MTAYNRPTNKALSLFPLLGSGPVVSVIKQTFLFRVLIMSKGEGEGHTLGIAPAKDHLFTLYIVTLRLSLSQSEFFGRVTIKAVNIGPCVSLILLRPGICVVQSIIDNEPAYGPSLSYRPVLLSLLSDGLPGVAVPKRTTDRSSVQPRLTRLIKRKALDRSPTG
jgi:hypothetical protein